MNFYAEGSDGALRCRLCHARPFSGHLSTCPLVELRQRVAGVVSQLGLYVAQAREELDDLDRALRGEEAPLI